MAKIATDFEKIINAGRERKHNEALAAKIFGTKDNRRSSAPGKPSLGSSLASRVGVTKRGSSAARIPPGDINREWTHDLHNSRSTPNLRAQSQRQQQQPKPNSLAARIHAPGQKPAVKQAPAGAGNGRGNNRAAKLASAVSRASTAQMNIAQAPPARGLTIRGLAGPFAVIAQNFAPGTTAADIESAVTPIGGIVSSCRLIKTHPLVIAEVVFESKEGADRVIETFNNQTADGRLLHVYHKPGGYSPPTGPRAQRLQETRPGGNTVIVDGSNGFGEPMETADAGFGGGGSGLYSDSLVAGGNNRRGRGFQSRGGGGRNAAR
ncbi:hypothetical protein JX265_002433 [Neoarthrinium moseri]|uniref:RRM domain-containing protein n=1 Tax=Neoarthrinium moseri TaxID=1658444 RepID=A0A9Q0AT03_9PEZI|nr:uncharacterized protein JN550_000247 [Neoarthrinium moseri]KAI1854794.1 hypothetical protein JX266_000912 [Neoarthrinium moseri]KAI1878065.1 hypothetical protein JN550_000247 [Neoarthrinium moseri]KAI1879479.1 hypothetical protein JX265_002433 [Neoarthrinium moseri]